MSDTRAGHPPRRAGLTRERILRASLAVIDEEGLDALTMRRVAGRLGVDPMALYRHVDGKDALLAGAGELLWAEVERNAVAGDWKEASRALVRTLRDLAHRHRDAFPMMLGVKGLCGASVRVLGQQLAALRRAGFDDRTGAEIVRAVLDYALGHGLTEQAALTLASYPEAGDADELVGIARTIFAERRDPEFGLEALLAAAERALHDDG